MYFFAIIYYLFLDYLLTTWVNIKSSFIKSVPEEWNIGEKGDIVLVQGFLATWISFIKIGNDLNRLGYKIHVIKSLSYNAFPLSIGSEILEEYIKSKSLKNVILLSHSKGGLIAKNFVDNFAFGTNIKLIISMASPYQGTLYGYLRFFNIKEFLPNGITIKNVLKNTKNNFKIVNLYAKVDNLIIPSKNAILPGAKNILIDVIGHTRILEDKRTIQEIHKYLQ